MIFDIHQHYNYGGDIDTYAAGLRKLNIRVGMSAGDMTHGQMGNPGVLDALKRHPDVFVGFYLIRLGKDTPSAVTRAHRAGFRGLKFIYPARPYDDRSYYGIYRKAQELGMPCLFHTGIVARADVAVLRDHADNPEVMKVYRRTDYAAEDIDCKRMEPFCCDTIARAFPRLTVIMAHYQGIGRQADAKEIIQKNPNAYADLTCMAGCHTPQEVRRAAEEFKLVINQYTLEKLLFGTDNVVSMGWQHMRKSIKSVQNVLRALKVRESVIKEIMGKRAGLLLGLEAGK